MKPSIGRVVHFVDTYYDPPQISPAMITYVDPPFCSLIVWPRNHPGIPVQTAIHESDVDDDNKAKRFWRWPPRVES